MSAGRNVLSDWKAEPVQSNQARLASSPLSSSSSSPDSQLLCQVCGAESGSWHYGAVVCEACKKFYIRSQTDSRYLTFACLTGKNVCEITAKQRSCQCCRLLKCIRVGMSMRREEQPESAHLNVDSLIKNIECAVCSSKSSGIHFGVITCEACKVTLLLNSA